jgi:hypothetical protein
MNYIRIIPRKLYLKYAKDTNNYYNKIKINNLLKTKPSHFLVSFREVLLYEFQDEFLKRYYSIKESRKHIPKFTEYYKNYISFFCKPIFRNLKLGKLILLSGEKCAENYYIRNYGNEHLNDDNIKIMYNSSVKNIFSDTVVESINGVCSLSFSNNSTNSKSINLNQSSFRFKKIYGNESSSLVNLLNDLNGKESNKFNINRKIQIKKNFKIKINEETRKKIMNNVLINKQKLNYIKSPLIIEKEFPNLNNKIILNKRKNSLNLDTKKIENTITRNSNLIYNYKTDISNKAKNLNNYLFSQTKSITIKNNLPKVKINSIKHSEKINISNFYNPKIKIINNKSKINKKKTNTMSLDFDNNKNKLNNKLIIQNYNVINYKSKKRNSTSYRINSLNRLNSNNTRNIEFQKIMTTSFNKFNNQQKLFNQNKNNKIMISCNISKRNKTYFSPEIRHYQNLTLNNKIKK